MDIGNGPTTEEHLTRLLPAERLAFQVAAGLVARDQNPGLNVTAELVLTIDRLIKVPS